MTTYRSQMIVLARGRFGSPASQVIERVRAQQVLSREDLALQAGLSAATTNRTVAGMVAAGLLRERLDLAASASAGGRPVVPVEIDPDLYVVIGVHLGRRTGTVAIGDLTGRVLAHEAHPHDAASGPDLDAVAVTAARLLGSLPGRRPLAAGVVAPWRDLGRDPEETGHTLQDLLGLEVATADHVAAVAATEFLHRRAGTTGVTLYVYARNTVGNAIAVDKGFATEISRVGSLTHFPAGSEVRCSCGLTGCLEVTASDDAVVLRAREEGLLGPDAGAPADIDAVLALAAGGDTRAHELLVERAHRLGRVAAIVRDMVVPHRVVLVGQAFTGYAPVLPDITAAFERSTALGPVDLGFTRFGAGIQAISACAIGLGPVYDDPMSIVPSAREVRSPSSPAVPGGAADGGPLPCPSGRRSA